MQKIAKLLTFWIPNSNLRKKIRKLIEKSDFTKITDKKNNTYPKYIDNLKIVINGENNIIEIDEKAVFFKSSIKIDANNSLVKINAVKYLRNLEILIYNGDNQTLEIGNNTSIEQARFFLCATASHCTVGDDCMLSSEIQVWTGDGHQVIDKKNNIILNDKKINLIIGRHCWIAFGTVILKNASIPDNTIVAAQSLVTKSFTENFTSIGGNPAKIIQDNVDWKREDPYLKG